MMQQLRQLVRRYLAREISYDQLRREFVRFMSASDGDEAAARVYNFIEAACSAFDNRYLSEHGFRVKLLQFAPPQAQAVQNANAMIAQAQESFVFVLNPNVTLVPSAVNSLAAGEPIPSTPAGVLSRELELEEV